MEIEQKYRTFWPRFWALFLDGAALAPIAWISQILWNNTTSILVLGFWELLTVSISLSYYIGFIYKYGQTPGKIAMGILVLSYKNNKLTFTQAILRNIDQVIFAPISLAIVFSNLADGNLFNRGLGDLGFSLSIGLIMILWSVLEIITMLFNKKRRALHDYIAGTVIIKQSLAHRPKSFSTIKYVLIALFIADLIVPGLLPENNINY